MLDPSRLARLSQPDRTNHYFQDDKVTDCLNNVGVRL